jgi:hypothetical protein
MTDDPVNQSSQGSATERRLRHAAGRCSVARGDAASIARIRPVRTSSVPVSGRGAKARPADRSIRSDGTDHTKATGRNSTPLAELCEKQWADYRDDHYPRFGCVSEYSEKAWVRSWPSLPVSSFRNNSPPCVAPPATSAARTPAPACCAFSVQNKQMPCSLAPRWPPYFRMRMMQAK